MFTIYCGEKKPNFKGHEKEQFKEFVKILKNEFEDKDDHYYLFVDYIISNKQIDTILLKKNAIVIIEMKSYSGELHGYENGRWYVEKDGKQNDIDQENNPFIQVRNQRYALKNFLQDKLISMDKRFADGIHNISGWLYLLDDGSYNKDQLQFKNRLWFDVVNPSNIVDFINDVDSNEFLFRENEMQEIVDFFGGYKFDAEKIQVIEKEIPSDVETEIQPPVITTVKQELKLEKSVFGEISVGSILHGDFWNENVRVISLKQIGENQIKIESVGVKTQRFYNPIVSKEDFNNIVVLKDDSIGFSGDSRAFFLFTEAHRIRNAFQFDPLYAVNVSQVDPLPHQIEAVYHYILKNPRVRFLLADDPGAGKTIMAGLLLKELKYRGLVNRILIVSPGHLKAQWMREMKEKFHENFGIVDRSAMDAKWGQNVWQEYNQIITSIDFAKQEDIMFSLNDTAWDMVIVDEAHKMSAYQYGEKISKTGRYKLGELISKNSDYLLFLTATPHRGDPDNFRLFLDLLEPGFFASNEMLRESITNKDNPLFLRRLKEDLKSLDGAPIFPPRNIKTMKFNLSDEEKRLYNEVTNYVEIHFNKALSKEKRNVAFAMTILQRRLASSVRAIRKSLERRKKRLEDLLEKGNLIQQDRISYTEEYLEDLEESERWKKEEDLLERLSSAETLDELKEEIEKLKELIDIAKETEGHEIETKLNELKNVIDSENLKKSSTKLLIFTEAKDTLEYLVEKLRKWNFSVTTIHGGMSLDKRIAAEAEFKNESQILVATEAAGEGINLQFCWLMVNYDIPWNPNRLEQRMGRVHRYGQQHEVYVYNLVAFDTREGRILHRIFEKLQIMKEQLGDRVFDVIGDVLQGMSLKDLILDAIANKRTMDDILRDIDIVPDEEAIERVKEASMEALATKHIDLRKILGEQRIARENRLVPEYIAEFFKKATDVLDIKMKNVDDKLWNVVSVPYEIRSRPHSFKLKYGVVNRNYKLISFDKQVAFRRTAEFVAMGHPLMEATIDTIFYKCRDEVYKGAVFIDPDGKRNGLLWFLEAEILDGAGRIAGRRMFSIYQDISGNLTLVNPAILWDFKPADESHVKEKIDYDKDRISAFVVENSLEKYKSSLLEARTKDASIKKKYGLQSLDSFISRSDEKLADYETRRMKGEDIPEVTILNEQRRRDQYIEKKERLKSEITAETHLLPQDPRILSVARIVPIEKLPDFMKADAEVEKIGMEVAMKHERDKGREPVDVSSENLGYDVRSTTKEDEFRYIEVKARSGMGSIVLTPNEWLMAQRLGDEYWLYVVANVSKKPELYMIQDPASKLKPDEEVSIVRYIVKDWREKADKEVQNE